MYLATMSRISEAMSEMKRAQELDPLTTIILTAQGRLFHFQRRYDDAIEWHRKALAIDPNFIEAHFNLGMVYEQKLMFREAISHFRKVTRLCGPRASFWSAGLGHAYGLAGMKKRAGNVLNQLLGATSPVSPTSPFDVAWVYLGLGEKDAALTWMDRAFAEHCSPLVYQNVEPALDPLRPDPRFDNLLHRLGCLIDAGLNCFETQLRTNYRKPETIGTGFWVGGGEVGLWEANLSCWNRPCTDHALLIAYSQ
jgi:tetratricopeptide (TPR) repeat protein